MEQIVSVIGFISLNYQAVLAAIVALFIAMAALLSAISAVAAFIPGPEPERTASKIAGFFSKIADFLSKFSRK